MELRHCCYGERARGFPPEDNTGNDREECIAIHRPAGHFLEHQADEEREWLREDEEHVVKWLLDGDKASVLAALARMAAVRPQLLRDALDALDAIAGIPQEGRPGLPQVVEEAASTTENSQTQRPRLRANRTNSEAAQHVTITVAPDPSEQALTSGDTTATTINADADARSRSPDISDDADLVTQTALSADGDNAEVEVELSPGGWQDSASRRKRRQNKKDDSRKKFMQSKALARSNGHKATRAAAALAMPAVQFACFTYFMNEEEGHVSLQVIRIGDLSKPSVVNFETKDGTAKKGVTYKHQSGTLNFDVDDSEKTIYVEVMPNKHWETTLQFSVELSWKDVQNARLGEHTWRSRIKVLDNNCFPSDKYRKQIIGGEIDDIPQWNLLWEYLKFNWGHPVVWQRSKKILLLDLFNNFIFLLELLLKTFLTDYLLHPQVGEGGLVPVPANGQPKSLALLLVVFWSFFPMIFQHRLDHMRTLTFGVGGPSRLILQSGLFRKFLEVDYATRSKMHLGDVRTAITRDASSLSAEGYTNFLKIQQELGDLIVMLCYTPCNCYLFGRYLSAVNAVPIVCIIIFPFILFGFLTARAAITTLSLRKRHASFGKMNEVVETVVSNFTLIAAYNQRPQAGESFASAVRTFNTDTNDCNAVLHNNLWFAKWLSKICTCAWIFIGGRGVMQDASVLTLGAFMVNLEIFSRMGLGWTSIYNIILEMETTLPAVARVTKFMNLPTDMVNWKNVSDFFRTQTLGYRRKHIHDDRPAGEALVDSLPIRLGNMGYHYTNMPDKHAKDFTGLLEIEQGQVACLAGPKGGGKSTILKLLGGEVFPSAAHLSESQLREGGCFFVPSHLRVLHVMEPMFMPGTLWDNLVFGSVPNSDEAKEDRVLSICRRLKISDEVMKWLHDSHMFAHVLSQTQRQLVSIARALTVNPEILIIHKPTLVFANSGKRLVEAAIREFVDNRGFECDPATKHLRRPRTCIMTASSLGDVECSDSLFRVGLRGGMQKMNKVARADACESDLHERSESSSGSASE